MSTKKGGKKPVKTTMNLTEFTGDKKAGDTSESMAWAEDDWEDEAQQEQALHAANAAKLFGRKAGAMDDFRSAAMEQLSTVVPEDMVAPFVAHIANLPNTITDEQLEENFADQFSVIAVGVVKRPKTTFGYVEVNTREELQTLILQTGRNIMGRKIRCDVATEQQIDRFKSNGKDAFAGLSRDAIGAETQPEFRQGGMGGGRGMRQSGSMDFSRDNFGDGQEGGMGFGGSVEELGDFRSAAPVAQPPAPGMGGNDRGGGRNWRGNSNNSSKPASPNVQAPAQEPQDFSSWRDAPVQAQPEAPAGEDKKEKKGTWSGKKGTKEASPVTKDAPSSTWRRDAPATKEAGEVKETVKETKKPAWGPKTTAPAPTANADNRFGALRK